MDPQLSPPSSSNSSDHKIGDSSENAEEPKFECFPKLPLELRLKIWKALCFIPRNVGLWAKPLGADDFWNDFGELERLFKFVTNLGAPAILHTCREAREEGLKYCTLAFGDDRWGHVPALAAHVHFPLDPKFYFNFDIDVPCLVPSNDPTFSDVLRKMPKNVARQDIRLNILAVEAKWLSRAVRKAPSIARNLRALGMKELVLYWPPLGSMDEFSENSQSWRGYEINLARDDLGDYYFEGTEKLKGALLAIENEQNIEDENHSQPQGVRSAVPEILAMEDAILDSVSR
jgi:hypothetical protein